MSNDIKKYLIIKGVVVIKLPTMNIKEDLYHVGSLDISKRKNNSHEGRGLSISTDLKHGKLLIKVGLLVIRI